MNKDEMLILYASLYSVIEVLQTMWRIKKYGHKEFEVQQKGGERLKIYKFGKPNAINKRQNVKTHFSTHKKVSLTVYDEDEMYTIYHHMDIHPGYVKW
jgi:hypothetical protein